MALNTKTKNKIDSLARESIHVIESVARIALEKIQLLGNQSTTSPLASINTFTDKSSDTLATINKENIEALRIIKNEPVISRIVALNEDGEEKIYYISRSNPSPVDGTNATFASYRAPIGRLASIPTGEDLEIEIEGKKYYFEVIEKIKYHPIKNDDKWDSINNIFESDDETTITIESLNKLLYPLNNEEEIQDILGSILQDDSSSDNIYEGIRRNVINSMSLRDQPILDKYQDEIFRLPLQTQLLIIGPPGTGKTTTLIRRLGQKLDKMLLPEEEQELIERFNTQLPHETSWIMFTPTELLKQYVKEAFNREGVPASESRIKTWEDYRRHLARNVLGVLKSSTGGTLILNDSNQILNEFAINNSIAWYESFSEYFHAQIMLKFKEALVWLTGNVDDPVLIGITQKIENILGNKREQISISSLRSIDKLHVDIADILKKYQEKSTQIIRKSLNLLLNTDKEFLKELSTYVAEIQKDTTLSQTELSDSDEEDDTDNNDMLSKNELTKDYNAAIRSLARAKARNKKLNKKSKNYKIISWLGSRLLSEEKLIDLGNNLEVQTHLRLFFNPIKLYINRVATEYRSFRRECIKHEQLWYTNKKIQSNHVNALELDIILLLSFKNMNSFLSTYSQAEIENNTRLSSILNISSEYKNQILVDEATDFSPIQLACMFEFTNPKIKSFFACGDFNQRITEWGTQTEEQMRWVSPSFDIKQINISYRQSKNLNQLASLISNNNTASIPEYAKSIDTPPVLAENIGEIEDLANWLKDRINEIESYVQSLPSVAIFVHNEDSVQPIATILNEKLIETNIRVVSCPEGRVMGQDGDIRVFDIQHIKGLEFEAVFFIGVDILAKQLPTLFDKYLYVGITRAATYLGITCHKTLPEKIKHTRQVFASDWETK